MIRLPGTQTLSAELRFGLSVVCDCSRLLRADTDDAIEVRVSAGGEPERLDASDAMRVQDGAVEISEGALKLVVRIAGATDEQRSLNADRFGRVPPADNFLASRGIERDPVINRLGVGFRDAVVKAAGRRLVALVAPWPDGRRWAMAMTHDLDVVSLWPVFTALRAAELAGKGRLRNLLSVLGSAAGSVAGNPVWNAARHVLDVERRHGIRSTWFVITGSPTFRTMRAGDVTYVPESPAVRRILDAVRDAGHEVGLHGSFETWTHADRFEAQRERLARLTSRPVTGVRQHFLRMRPGRTHQAMRAAGFQYDSSYGYADRNGFRLGIADPLPVWDESLGRGLSIDAVPFVWMDRALSKYRGVEDPAAWIEDALALARTCREMEGVWTGIWHPNLSAPLGFPGAEAAFDQLCTRLMADAPWAASLGEIVGWRRERRAAKALGLTPAGDIRLGFERGDRYAIALEDAAGRRLPSVVA